MVMKRMRSGLLLLLGLAACDGVFSDPEMIHLGPTQDAPAIDGSIVFTTSQKYRGGLLGGVEGADAICADHASEAGLTGEFKAWLSQVGSSAADRLTHSTKPYILVDGTKVADSWDDLLRFDLLHPIDVDENGAKLTPEGSWGAPVWSATRVDGQAVPWTEGGTPTSNPRLDCTLWSSLDGGVGLLGSWSATDIFWTNTSGGILCNETARLYCFEQ
jgi:hypothetical protein